MKTFSKTLIIAAASCTLAFAAKPSSNDKILPLEQQAVSFSQVLYADDPVMLGDSGLNVASKSYYQEVTGAELKQGFSLKTTGHSAVVRVTPVKSITQGMQKVAPTIEPADLEISSPAGAFNVSKSGMSLTATSKQLNEAHPQLFKNTAAFVLDETVGAGEFVLKTNKSVDNDDRYLIHVFDKHSNYELNLTSSRSSLGNGETLKVKVSLTDQAASKHIALNKKSVAATLVSPDGTKHPMTVRMGKSGATAEVDLNFDLSRSPGELWKVVVDTQANGQENLKRTGELAIDLHQKTANISNYSHKGSSLAVTVNVEKAGRYEVRAWMFEQVGKQREPAFLEYFAQWLEPGTHTLKIPLNNAKKGITVAQLQLLDQTRLAVLETIN